MRTATQAVAYSRRYTRYRTQYCLNFVQTMLGAPWSGPSAVWAWDHAKGKHGPDPSPPPGAPVWFLGSKYGHIALSVGGGRCRSTDYPGPGQVGEVGIEALARKWGRRYVGWAEYLGGAKIPGINTTTPTEDDDMTPEQDKLLRLVATRTDHLANKIGLGSVVQRSDYVANKAIPDILKRLTAIEARLKE